MSHILTFEFLRQFGLHNLHVVICCDFICGTSLALFQVRIIGMDPLSIAGLTIAVLDQLWKIGEGTAQLVSNFRDFDSVRPCSYLVDKTHLNIQTHWFPVRVHHGS